MKADKISNKSIIFRLTPFLRATAFITLVAFIFTCVPADMVSASTASHVPERQIYESLDPSSFTLPLELGIVKDSWSHAPDSNSPVTTVIHIQDAHCNYAAQKKIAEIIAYLGREYGVDSVNLEGGEGSYDFSLFTSINNAGAMERISDDFVRQGLVSGGEYFALNNQRKVALWGVEDADLYMKNLGIYRASLEHRSIVEKYLKGLSAALSALKTKIYSKDLIELDLKYSQHKTGNIDLKSYIKYLLSLAAARSMDITVYRNLDALRGSFEAEAGIDFAKANAERDELIAFLQRSLSLREAEELSVKGAQLAMGRMTQQEFYSYIAKKARLLGIDPSSLSSLSKYIDYINVYGAADTSGAMEELEELEGRLKHSLCENDNQRELVALSKNLTILKSLLSACLTRRDYGYYKANEASFDVRRYLAFIAREAPKYDIDVRLGGGIEDLDGHRRDMERFYEFSLNRDAAFIKNLKFTSNKQRAAILVTGGFHTENLCELFRKNNISYISVVPNFRNEKGYECPYFKLLSGDPRAEFIKAAHSAGLSALAIPSNLNGLGEKAAASALPADAETVPAPASRAPKAKKIMPALLLAGLLIFIAGCDAGKDSMAASIPWYIYAAVPIAIYAVRMITRALQRVFSPAGWYIARRDADSLVEMGAGAVPRLRDILMSGLYRMDIYTRKFAADTLARIDDPSAIEALVDAIGAGHDSEIDHSVERAVIARGREAVPYLTELAKSGESASSARAIEVLIKLGAVKDPGSDGSQATEAGSHEPVVAQQQDMPGWQLKVPAQPYSFTELDLDVEMFAPENMNADLYVTPGAFNPTGESRATFDRIHNQLYIDGKPRKFNDQDDITTKREDFERDYMKGHPDSVSFVLPNGNLGWNNFYIAVVKGVVKYYPKDPLTPREMLVARKGQRPVMAKVAFTKRADNTVRVIDPFATEPSKRDITDDIELGLYGLPLVRDGKENVKGLFDQLDDIRHFARIPRFQFENKQEWHPGMSDGIGALYNDPAVRDDLRNGRPVELSIRPLLEKGVTIGQIKAVYDAWGYSGKYTIDPEKLTITCVYEAGTHPHSYFGITKDGRWFIGSEKSGRDAQGNTIGLQTHFAGTSLKRLAHELINKYDAEYVWIWANGKDVALRVDDPKSQAEGVRKRFIEFLIFSCSKLSGAKSAASKTADQDVRDLGGKDYGLHELAGEKGAVTPGAAHSLIAHYLSRIPLIGNLISLIVIYPHEFFHALADGFRGHIEILRESGRVTGGRYVARDGEGFARPWTVLMAAPAGMWFVATALIIFLASGMPGLSEILSGFPHILGAIRAFLYTIACLFSLDVIVNIYSKDPGSDGSQATEAVMAAARGKIADVRQARSSGGQFHKDIGGMPIDLPGDDRHRRILDYHVAMSPGKTVKEFNHILRLMKEAFRNDRDVIGSIEAVEGELSGLSGKELEYVVSRLGANALLKYIDAAPEALGGLNRTDPAAGYLRNFIPQIRLAQKYFRAGIPIADTEARFIDFGGSGKIPGVLLRALEDIRNDDPGLYEDFTGLVSAVHLLRADVDGWALGGGIIGIDSGSIEEAENSIFGYWFLKGILVHEIHHIAFRRGYENYDLLIDGKAGFKFDDKRASPLCHYRTPKGYLGEVNSYTGQIEYMFELIEAQARASNVFSIFRVRRLLGYIDRCLKEIEVTLVALRSEKSILNDNGRFLLDMFEGELPGLMQRHSRISAEYSLAGRLRAVKAFFSGGKVKAREEERPSSVPLDDGMRSLAKISKEMDGPVLIAFDGAHVGKSTTVDRIVAGEFGFDPAGITMIRGDAFASLVDDVRAGRDNPSLTYSAAYEAVRRDSEILRSGKDGKYVTYAEYLGYYFKNHIDELVSSGRRIILFDHVGPKSSIAAALKMYPELRSRINIIHASLSSDASGVRYAKIETLPRAAAGSPGGIGVVAQIGKRATAEVVSGKVLKVTRSDGSVSYIDLVRIGKLDISGLKSKIDRMRGIDPGHKEIVLSVLSLLEKSPPGEAALPDLYAYRELVDDLFAKASPKDSLIAMHISLSENPVALFHEVCHYLIESGLLSVKYSERKIEFFSNGHALGRPVKIDKLEARRKIMKGRRDPHYLLRVLQLEIFGQYDKGLTQHIKLAQIEAAGSRVESVCKYISMAYANLLAASEYAKKPNPYFYPEDFADIFRRFYPVLGPEARADFDLIMRRIRQWKWREIFWRACSEPGYEWTRRMDSFESNLAELRHPIGRADGESGEEAFEIIEYLDDDLKDIPQGERNGLAMAAKERDRWIDEGIDISRSPDEFMRAVLRLHAMAAGSLDSVTVVDGLSQPRWFDVENAQRPKPFPPADRLEGTMKAFADIVCSRNFRIQHPVIQAADAYLELTDMQYFPDGNRRVAKLVSDYFLKRGGLPALEITPDNTDEFREVVRFMDKSEDYADFLAQELVKQMARAGLAERLREIAVSPDKTERENVKVYGSEDALMKAVSSEISGAVRSAAGRDVNIMISPDGRTMWTFFRTELKRRAWLPAADSGHLDISKIRLIFATETLGTPNQYQEFMRFCSEELPPGNNAFKEVAHYDDTAMSREGAVEDFKARLASLGRIDLALLALGPEGQLAYNQRHSPMRSVSRICRLSNYLRAYGDVYSKEAFTVGVSDILKADRIAIVAMTHPRSESDPVWRIDSKADALYKAVHEMGVPASMVRTKPGSGFVILSDSATAEKLPEAERVADDGSGIIRAVMQMFDDVRFREEPRVFFIPAKGDISAYEAARSDIKYALGRYDGPDGGFKNVRVVFYDGTKADLEAKRSALEDKEALALAFVDSDAVSEAELKAHNTASLRYKWIRESMPEGGVPVGELFMHVAFGLPVLDYVRNSSDPDHKLVLMGIIERMVANGKADLDLIKTDFNNLFVSGIILMLKKITKVDINSEMHKRSRNLKEVLAAA